MRPLATPFLVGLLAVTGLSFAGIFVEQDVRRTIWLIAVVLILLGGLSQSLRSTPLIEEAVRVTESMAERFGLFTIIVLGEMVVGVVDGVSESERQAIHLVTAGLALFVGTGFWWNYFDFVGRRVPRAGAAARSAWIYGHLVLATAVAATGAGLVALVEHAGDSRLPVNVSWLVAGGISGVAFGIALLVAVMPRRPGAARVAPLLVCTGTIVLMVAALRPAGWLLAIAALGSFSFVWFDAFVLHSRDGDPIAR